MCFFLFLLGVYAYAIIAHIWADQLLPQLLMEQLDTFPLQCRHIRHIHEGVWFRKNNFWQNDSCENLDKFSLKRLLCFCSVLCLLCLCVLLFICALWSPAGKGLASWLSFVVSNCEFVTFPLVSWVRCGTWLYRFLIFTPLLILYVHR